MKHFGIHQWADYVRGLGSGVDRDSMRQHAAGCSTCGATVANLSKVHQTAEADNDAGEVPQQLTASCYAIFSPPVPPFSPGLARLLTKLVFDSGLTAVPIGARSALPAARHLVYDAQGYRLELRVQENPNGAGLTLVGQVNQPGPASPDNGNLPVYLLSSKKVLASTISNEFGEFCLEFPARRNLKLCVPLPPAGGQLEVGLGRLVRRN